MFCFLKKTVFFTSHVKLSCVFWAACSMSSFPWLCLLFDTSKGLFLTSCHAAGHSSCSVHAMLEEKAGDLAIMTVL